MQKKPLYVTCNSHKCASIKIIRHRMLFGYHKDSQVSLIIIVNSGFNMYISHLSIKS